MGKYQELIAKLKKGQSSNQKNLNNPAREVDGYATAIPANSVIPDDTDSIQEFEKHQCNNQKNLINPDKGSCLGLLGNSTGAFQKINVPEALGRTMDYLIRDDARLPGMCLFSRLDIDDIETGVLPLDNARLYLESIERQFPHLGNAERDPDEHPLESAISRLIQEGLEIIPDDRRFIRERLGHRMNWKALLDGYVAEWLLAAATTPQPHKRQNAGRFAANTWLRESAP